MKSSDIRQAFLDFFHSKQHHIVPSAPMVIKNDPTLMFTNAGMNQFKDFFLGHAVSKYPRIANTQKCLRVSGKHNDLEEVGHDTYHHTMFEMLGNWSFGDYFKKEAIEWAWELLTEVLKIDKSRLYVTVFGGDAGDGLAPDNEAFAQWKTIVPEDRIIYGSRKDNFWEMGDTGPCGPCSEIHIDIRVDADTNPVSGRELVNTGNPEVIEIWNLVFIEFNRKQDGSLEPLPARHVDTGMGFERLSMVMQGVRSNYDTDIFRPLIAEVARLSGMRYGDDPAADVAMRVVADHIRAIAFAICDGQLPSNNKAGYVIRRILRRAVRYGFTFLGFREAFMHRLLPLLSEQMGDVFPELRAQSELASKVICEEEQAFLRTLSVGIQKFDNYQPAKGSNTVDGAFAFELFDTYGFPLDLTSLMAREKGMEVDMAGFEKNMQEQKNRSRQAAVVDKDDWTIVDENGAETLFTGYEEYQTSAAVIKYRQVKSKDKSLYHIVLDKTPFYAESGGQCGDKGVLISGNEKISVLNTIRENNLIIHICPKLPSEPSAPVTAVIDPEKRKRTAANHSATHLLHASLRKVLGEHVEQKGSLVDDEKLRFDFSHFSRMEEHEIRSVEALVNEKIRENIPLAEHRSLSMDEAMNMGAIALFGEKYGEKVRVIRFGNDFSSELCGGTHVNATGQIGFFKIISEASVAAGIRRIEAVTGAGAEAIISHDMHEMDQLRQLLKTKEPLKMVIQLQEKLAETGKKVESLINAHTASLADQLAEQAVDKGKFRFIAARVDEEAAIVKNIAYAIVKKAGSVFCVLSGEWEGKAHLTVAVSEDVIRNHGLSAAAVIKTLSKEINGGGGGQDSIATAGGKNPAGIGSALEIATRLADQAAAQ